MRTKMNQTKSIDIFPWNDNFNTGIVKVDEQHKRLVQLLNILVSHVAFHADIPSLNSILDELVDYSVYHFQTEEEIWQEYLSEDILGSSHKVIHDNFVTKISQFRQDLNSKPVDGMVEEVLAYLTHWLAAHILENDRYMAFVVQSMRTGIPLELAKLSAKEKMSGSTKALIDIIIATYDSLSTNTLQLMRELAEHKRLETALYHDQERLRSMLENSPIAARIATSRGRKVKFANKRYAKLINRTVEQVTGADPKDYYANSQEYEDILTQLNRGHTVTDKLIELRVPDIGSVWTLATYLQIEYENTPAVLGWFYDVTEIRETGVQLKLLTENISDLISRHDLEGKYLYVTGACLRLQGFTEEELVGHSCYEYFHPDDVIRIQDTHKQILERPSETFTISYRLRHKNFSYVWVESTVRATLDSANNIADIVSATRDITERKKIEDALKLSEQYLRNIIETEPECVKVVDSRGRLLDMNAAGLAMLEADSLGIAQRHTLQDYVVQKDRAAFIALHQRVMNGESGSTEFEIKGLKGTHRYLETHATPMRDIDGEVVALLGVTREVTERKLSELMIASSREQLDSERLLFHTILENAPIGIWMLGIDGKIKFINKTFCKAVGVTEQQFFEARHYSDLLPASVTVNCIKSDCECYEQEAPHLSMEWLPFVDGKEHLLEITKVKLFDQNGSLIGLTGLAVDITEPNQAEKELRIAATAFETHEGMIVTDADTNILRINHAFTSITGYSAEEVIGKKSNILNSGRQNKDFYRDMWESIRNIGSWEGELWNRRKNGEIYPEHLTINVVKDHDGNITNYVGAQSDSTERQQTLQKLRTVASELELANAKIEQERASLVERVEERTAQLEYANKAKDSFLATMSHEIRTPLGGMLGMMELLNLSALNAEQRNQLHTAQLSGRNLLRIVNDILDWSKIEAGKLALSPHNAYITEMLNGVARTYTQLASDKSISLNVTVDPKLSKCHVFDPLRLSQILNNFTSNAVKFTQQGAIEISAQKLNSRNGYETVRFSVKDSGNGIDKEQQSRLFQHYEQATADTARMYGGTGLGLSICRRLAELMDGTLSVESMIGLGSTFYFTISLPVASVTTLVETSASSLTPTEKTAQQAGGEETPLIVDGRPLAVLIVDDHPVNRMLLKQQLSMLGVQVEAAESGTPAMTLWQRTHFDIIITDCHMPEMDGYELTRQIRTIEAQAGSVHMPIIAWTANVLSDEVERCQVAGMDDMLTKPTELVDMRAMLLKWMNRK